MLPTLRVDLRGLENIYTTPFYKSNIIVEGLQDESYTLTKEETLAPQPFGSFSCPVQSRQCYHVEDNVRCTKSTTIQPYCISHMKEQLQLEVKESTIKGAGKGLFASSREETNATLQKVPVFKRSELIHYFEGETMTYRQYEDRYGARFDPTNAMWYVSVLDVTLYKFCITVTTITNPIGGHHMH